MIISKRIRYFGPNSAKELSSPLKIFFCRRVAIFFFRRFAKILWRKLIFSYFNFHISISCFYFHISIFIFLISYFYFIFIFVGKLQYFPPRGLENIVPQVDIFIFLHQIYSVLRRISQRKTCVYFKTYQMDVALWCCKWDGWLDWVSPLGWGWEGVWHWFLYKRIHEHIRLKKRYEYRMNAYSYRNDKDIQIFTYSSHSATVWFWYKRISEYII